MSERSLSALSGFTRIVLPGVVFSSSEQQLSMLLTQRVGQGFVRRVWKEFCEESGMSGGPGVEAFDTSATWLGGRLASVVFLLPAPQHPGEAHLALLVVPASPAEQPRRYFTLEIPETPATEGAAGVLYESVPGNEPGGFGRVHHRDGLEPQLQSFCAAVEQVLGLSAEQPTNDGGAKETDQPAPKDRRWWQFWN